MTKILILNGPNLNLLGSREPDTYGSSTLGEINTQLQALATHPLVFFQSNAEHELLEKIQHAPSQDIKFIIFNPAAFTHSSIALRDALLAIQIPFIEVHLSNIYAREIFRHQSYFSDIAYGTLTGFGPLGYQLALKAAEHYLARE